MLAAVRAVLTEVTTISEPLLVTLAHLISVTLAVVGAVPWAVLTSAIGTDIRIVTLAVSTVLVLHAFTVAMAVAVEALVVQLAFVTSKLFITLTAFYTLLVTHTDTVSGARIFTDLFLAERSPVTGLASTFRATFLIGDAIAMFKAGRVTLSLDLTEATAVTFIATASKVQADTTSMTVVAALRVQTGRTREGLVALAVRLVRFIIGAATTSITIGRVTFARAVTLGTKPA